jgi:hypothetical protein
MLVGPVVAFYYRTTPGPQADPSCAQCAALLPVATPFEGDGDVQKE